MSPAKSMICWICCLWVIGNEVCIAQVQDVVKLTESPQSVCILEPIAADAFTYVAPRKPAAIGGKRATSTIFQVAYLDSCGAATWPEAAKTAFEAAVNVWNDRIQLVTNGLTIDVQAEWSDKLSSTGLGAAGATAYWRSSIFPNQNAMYPDALADDFFGEEWDSDTVEIVVRMNCQRSDWYFGTDGNTPSGKYDFMTVVLHEIAHGLGFSGGMRYGSVCGASNWGCWWSSYPKIYDTFTEDLSGNQLINTTIYPDGSEALGNILTTSQGVVFDGPLTAQESALPVLYTPSTWKSGSSFSHLDESMYPAGHTESLMTPFLSAAEAMHEVGIYTCAMLGDIGWSLGPGCSALLPIELVTFEGYVEDQVVRLIWETLSETGNVGFEVQEWQQGWRSLGFVAGAGTTSQAHRYAFEVGRRAPGLFRYRLRQWDVDGRYTYSPTIEVQVTTPDVWVEGPYPNPLRRESKIRVALPYTQDVKLTLYSVLGQPVKVIGHQRLEAQVMHTFRIDVHSLASGFYLLVIEGETFRRVFPLRYVQ